MSFDFSAIDLSGSDELVDVPQDAIKRVVVRQPGPFDEWFKRGVTPEGKGYPIPLAGNAEERAEMLKEIRKALGSTAQWFNESEHADPKRPLSHSVSVVPGRAVVRIVLKGSRPRKDKGDPKNAGTVKSVKTGDSGNGKPEISKTESKPENVNQAKAS